MTGKLSKRTQPAIVLCFGAALLVLASVSAAVANDLIAADAARGAEAFQKVCSACHTIEKGARRRVGPNLFGVAGARIGQSQGYPYSAAFRAADITWDEETLSDFLAAPGSVVRGTKMDWSVRDEQQIADLIAFLKVHR